MRRWGTVPGAPSLPIRLPLLPWPAQFIKSTTVVGVLPQPHAIVQRVYQPNAFTALWFTTYAWSTVFLQLGRELPMFDAEAIRLFQITVV